MSHAFTGSPARPPDVTMEYLAVRNWGTYQHYKDRNPPWIKVHTSLLDDYEFSTLSRQARSDLMSIWLLAARCDNHIPHDREWIAHAIRVRPEELELDVLLDGGWLVRRASKALVQDASNVLPLDASPSRGEERRDNRGRRARAREGTDDAEVF